MHRPGTLIRLAWPILFEAARQGRTISYAELAGRIGPPAHHRHIHRQLLNDLSAGCRRAGVPDLAALVVRKDTGRPGLGWYAGEVTDDPVGAWADAVASCIRHPWPARPPKLLVAPPKPFER